MVKNLEEEQNPIASREQRLNADARDIELNLLSNPLANYEPALLKGQSIDFSELNPNAQAFQVSQYVSGDPTMRNLLVPQVTENSFDDRGAISRFSQSLMSGVIDTGGLALQGISEAVAAGTATDDNYKNFFEEFASGNDSTLWKAGQAVRDANREWFGEVDFTDDDWVDDLGYVFGNLGGFIGAGVAGTAVGGPLAGIGMMAALGGGMAAGDMAERARSLGYDEYDIEFSKAVGASFGLGTLEAAPIGLVASKLSKLSKGGKAKTAMSYSILGKIIGKNPIIEGVAKKMGNNRLAQVTGDVFTGAVSGAFLEGGQEYAQAIAQDYIEQMFLDPEKTIGWAENQYEGILGGIAGGTLTAIVYPFAKAKTRRIKAAIDAEKEIAEGIDNMGGSTPTGGFQTVLADDDYYDMDVDEELDPFGFDTVELTPFDDNGPDWRPKTTKDDIDDGSHIDVYDLQGRKKRVRVISRDQETGQVDFELDGEPQILGFEYDTKNPLDENFELSGIDGKETKIKPKDLSNEQLLALLADRRTRIKDRKKTSDKFGAGQDTYYSAMRDGFALKKEAEKRGIYNKPTAETKAVKETVEELDPKDIADTATTILDDGYYTIDNRPSVQRARAANKNSADQNSTRAAIDKKDLKGKFIGKVGFITKAQAENLAKSFNLKSKFIDPTRAQLRSGVGAFQLAGSNSDSRFTFQDFDNQSNVGGANIPQIIVTKMPGKTGSRYIINDTQDNLNNLNSYIEEGINAIPIQFVEEGTDRNKPAVRAKQKSQIDEASNEIVDIFLPDGTRLEYDKRSWSNTFGQEEKKVVKKKTKGPAVPTKSTPKFGPFGDTLDGKVVGTDTVPSYALEYMEQMLAKLNMSNINIFVTTDKDRDGNGHLTEKVAKKHSVYANPSSDKRRAKFKNELSEQGLTRGNVYIVGRAQKKFAGHIQHEFGPDFEINKTYTINLDTSSTSYQIKRMFDTFNEADLNRSVDDMSILSTVAHEVGHIMEWELFNNSDTATKRAVLLDYLKYLQIGKTYQNLTFTKSNPLSRLAAFAGNQHTAEIYRNSDGSFNNDALMKDITDFQNYEVKYGGTVVSGGVERPSKKRDYNIPNKDQVYHGSFAEWFAEQSSRWALTNIPPKTLSEKFFAKVAEFWKRLFKTITPVDSISKMYETRSQNPLWAHDYPNKQPPPGIRSNFTSWGRFDTAEDQKATSRYGVPNEKAPFNITDKRIQKYLDERFVMNELGVVEDRNQPLGFEGVIDRSIDTNIGFNGELKDGLPISKIIEDPEIVEAVEKSVERTEAEAKVIVDEMTEEEKLAALAEPIVPDEAGVESDSGDGDGTSDKKAPKKWKVNFLKWVQSPLKLWSMRNPDGTYVYPQVRKVIEKFQFNTQSVTSKMSRIFKRYNDVWRKVPEAERADVSAVIVEGDRQGKKYSLAELQEGIVIGDKTIKLTKEGIDGYNETRNTLDELGTLINEHNDNIRPKATKRLNDLLADVKKTFDSLETPKFKDAGKVEIVERIKDPKTKNILGYVVALPDGWSMKFTKKDFPEVNNPNGKQLEKLIMESDAVKAAQEIAIAKAKADFEAERAEIDIIESLKEREEIYNELKRVYRTPKLRNAEKAKLREENINRLNDRIREIEKEIGYKRGYKNSNPYQLELNRQIVMIDIENSRIKPEFDIKTNDGYLPHIWFGSHSVRIVSADGKVKNIFSEQGYFDTDAQARQAAENFIEANPKYKDDKIVVVNRGTTWADSAVSATILNDKTIEKLAVSLTADQLEDVRTGRQSLAQINRDLNVKMGDRRVTASFEKERLGAEGYSTDTQKILGSHIQNVMRFLILDEMKYDANEIQQALDDGKYSSVDNLMKDEFRNFINDISNVEGGFENTFDSVFDSFFNTVDNSIDTLTKGKVKGLDRATLYSGMTGLGAAGVVGIFGAPVIGLIIGVPLGMMVYGRVKASSDAGIVSEDGSTKVFDPTIQAILGISAHTKLGMFMNLLSPIVNLSQTVINTSALYSYSEIVQSYGILSRYTRGKMTGTDTEFTTMWDQRFDEGGVDVDQGLFTDGTEMNLDRGTIAKYSMFLFQKAEVFNRMMAYTAGHTRATNNGKTEKQARFDGQKAWNDTQFFYDKSDTSKILRIKGLKVGTQFKNFLFKQTAFTLGIWKDAELNPFNPKTRLEKDDGTIETAEEAVARIKEMRKVMLKQLLHIYILAGALGLPGLQALDWLIRSLFGDEYSPVKFLMRTNLDAHANGEATGMMGDLFVKGLPTLVGQDISSRVGLGNRFIPYNDRLSIGDNLMDQFKGPFISTLINARKLQEAGATFGDQTVNITSGIGKPLKGIEMLAGGQDLAVLATTDMSTLQLYAETVMKNLASPSNIVYTSGYKSGQVVSNKVSRLDVFNYMIGGRPTKFSLESDLNELLMFDDNNLDRETKKVYTDMAYVYTRYAKTDPEKFREELNRIRTEAREDDIPINNGYIRRMFRNLRNPRAINTVKKLRKSQRPEYLKYIKDMK